MMNIDELDYKYEEFLINRKIYLQKGINQPTVCRMMKVSIEELNMYLKEELNITSFDVMIDNFRIDEAKDIWNKWGATPISRGLRQCFRISVSLLATGALYAMRLEKKNAHYYIVLFITCHQLALIEKTQYAVTL